MPRPTPLQPETRPLSSPRIYLVRMGVFLILVGFIGFILYRQLLGAFFGNPGLNGLILGILFVGIVLAIRQVWRLFREVRWVNELGGGDGPESDPPVLLAPMATLIGNRKSRAALSVATTRSLLDSLAARLDESRELVRYLAGLLVFLGLLGTFWGLVTTVSSVGATIQTLSATGNDVGGMFEDLKQGLAAPLAGMGIAFSSSLFGLAGSLVLGFLDLQASQAQNRFYTELEDWLSTITDPEELGLPDEEPGTSVGEIRASVERLARLVQEGGGGRASAAAMANLAEGIQGMVQHMRKEQQLVRDWMDAQSVQHQALQDTLKRLAAATERNVTPLKRVGEPDDDRRPKGVAEIRRET